MRLTRRQILAKAAAALAIPVAAPQKAPSFTEQLNAACERLHEQEHWKHVLAGIDFGFGPDRSYITMARWMPDGTLGDFKHVPL